MSDAKPKINVSFGLDDETDFVISFGTEFKFFLKNPHRDESHTDNNFLGIETDAGNIYMIENLTLDDFITKLQQFRDMLPALSAQYRMLK